MDGTSLTPQQQKLNALREILPEAFSEGKIDWEKLKATLGEDINFTNERYVLNWAGKSDAFKVLQSPTTNTLIPDKEESINFDETKNIFIEGENLEVLKVLQKSYFGKVKMIYIDPPYNTGSDSFIYPDKFAETKAEYEKRVGDKDEEGYMTKDGMFKKNSKENGQYHSNWMNMMYPRLFLAKNLLKHDGVIFVSIDDNEVHNLRLIMDEVFGEENFRGTVIRATGTRMGSGNKEISSETDYVLVYSKSLAFQFSPLPMSSKDLKIYDQEDEKGLYLTRSLRRTGGENRREDRPSMFYPVTAPDGTEVLPIAPEGWKSRWICGKDTYKQLLKDKMIVWKNVVKKGKYQWQVYQKHYVGDAVKFTSNLWTDIDGNKKATREVNALFDGIKYFDHPKPIDFIKRCVLISTDENDIVLDFFAGSGTTGHTVLELNKDLESSRNFITVQLAEKCDESSNAFKDGYLYISQIAKDRLRKIAKKIEEENPKYKGDLGFKVLKLSDSNFKQWQQIKGKDAKALEEQMKLFVDPVSPSATVENMVYELLLKSGKDLNSKIEQKDNYYSINNKELIFILEKADKKIVDAVLKEQPQKVIALDKLFKDNDQLKTNTALQMKDSGIEFKTI